MAHLERNQSRWAIVCAERREAALNGSASRAPASDQAHDKDQDARAHKRYEERPEEPSTPKAKRAKNEAANERSNDAHDNVPNDTKAAAAHDKAGQPSG